MNKHTIAGALGIAALAAAGCGTTEAPSSAETTTAQHAKAKFDPTPILKRMESRQSRLAVLVLRASKAYQAAARDAAAAPMDSASETEEAKNIEVRVRVLLNAQRRDFNRLDTHREGLSPDVLKKIDMWGEIVDQAEEDQASVEATS